ncbi:16S rRNA (guanine(966)-N(2))-methyltransferase RsmD [Nakamurella flavida]|uniref:16S rRNA (Guanine(966)-N(2))-methyltransferase RsmD n=1 Tax=Nakamurella flavida TaxID=363630 RepID=A0A939BYM8_9ACTN|nr:16S rRNA (guanine(966)-N(2))-methyltransferase RsmD [Nakamurella flavida]MBM9474853.1 16S rRNA (guanine(966)-N(2))-methyltransferase RsmD [Nakamurella flavida]MDP9776423.1 16S rRNA (guanine966-N2)-methyltransferase [Nakamurella flavida]
MTRIVAGEFGGRRLVTPAGELTRPTAEKVRAALGSSLYAAGGLAGARVLDLYAGTGALGLELLSRGADQVVLVEQDRAALAAARANVQALGVGARVEVVPRGVAAYAALAGESFDVVVADPPYDVPDDEIAAVLTALVAGGRFRPAADVVVERRSKGGAFGFPEPLSAVREKRYGDTRLCYGRAP